MTTAAMTTGACFPPMTAPEIYAALKARFAPPKYGLLLDVPNGTGGHKERSADALAMSCWPSRGLELIGFEVKSSRSDWARELSNPAKAEAICRYCDRWYVVAGSDATVRLDELPRTWGLMFPNRTGKLVTVVDAPALSPEPVDRAFLAAIFRRSAEKVGGEEVSDKSLGIAREEGITAGERRGREECARELESARGALARLQEAVRDFEEASGVAIAAWEGRRIGEAVKFVLGSGLTGIRRRMENAEAEARQVLKAVQGFQLRDLEILASQDKAGTPP